METTDLVHFTDAGMNFDTVYSRRTYFCSLKLEEKNEV